MDLLGFNAMGQIEWMLPSKILIYSETLTGPILPINVWIHVVVSFCDRHWICLYIDGTMVKRVVLIGHQPTPQVTVMTLGNALRDTNYWMGSSCPNQSIVPEPYVGLIDEFRVYSRALKVEEIFELSQMRPL